MQLRTIEVGNFKSLVGFKLDLAKFTCLVGLNGAGKSTVLQFIDFLAQLMRGELDEWLRERQWKATDVLSRLRTPKRTVGFTATLVDDDGSEIVWRGTFHAAYKRVTHEKVNSPAGTLEVDSGRYTITGAGDSYTVSEQISFTYQGSILSQLRDKVLPDSLKRLRRFFIQTESLDMLTPERLRQRTRTADSSLGRGGRHLSSFVGELGPAARRELSARLRRAYPHLGGVYTRSLRSGWKELFATEAFRGGILKTDARHLNDGMLRYIAILAELASEHMFVLFDEIENGINPELVELVLDSLVGAKQQILVTTHSPMILNYLDDEVAKQGVMYIYKNRLGRTQALPLFQIPSLAEKLKVMGPGEAFVDTNLLHLDKEIAGLNGGGA